MQRIRDEFFHFLANQLMSFYFLRQLAGIFFLEKIYWLVAEENKIDQQVGKEK